MVFRENDSGRAAETLDDLRKRLSQLRWIGRSLGEGTDGQSAIEFAFCLPVLLLLVTGIATFGIAFNNYVTLTEATSVGARQIAVERAQGGDPCALAASAIAAAAPLLKNTGSATTGIGYSFTVYTTPTTSTPYKATPATCSGAQLTQGMPVTVATTYPCNLKVFAANLVPNCSLTAQTTEVVQ